MNSAIRKAIALIFVLSIVTVSAYAIASDSSNGDSGKYILDCKTTKGFDDLNDGTITITFQRYSDEKELNIKITSMDGASTYIDSTFKLPAKTADAEKFDKSFSFRLGAGDTVVKIAVYEGGVEEEYITHSIHVERSVWKNPAIWVAIILAVIAVAILGFMRYRHVTDSKKSNSKEKVFTKMAEEKKRQKQGLPVEEPKKKASDEKIFTKMSEDKKKKKQTK